MLDYDREAERYDDTRGGLPRARAAAESVATLLPPTTGPILDIAGGTGIVAQALASSGYHVLVADRSYGMLTRARDRSPGRVVQADASRLPFRDGSLRAVTAIWFLHLLDDAEPVVAEVARVLAPGGRFVTTVDKNAARKGYADPAESDARDRIGSLTRAYGLSEVGSGRFVGHGQSLPGGRVPTYSLVAFDAPSRAVGS